MSYLLLAPIIFAFFALLIAAIMAERRSVKEIEEIRDRKIVYAEKGETITCENDHPICDFAETVYVCGHMDLSTQLTNWRQNVPKRGDARPSCAICNKNFVSSFCTNFHFADGWRTRRDDQPTRRPLAFSKEALP